MEAQLKKLAYINVSVTNTTGPNNMTSFIDFNRSLVLWMRFDNSSDMFDHSTYSLGNSPTNVGSTYYASGSLEGKRI